MSSLKGWPDGHFVEAIRSIVRRMSGKNVARTWPNGSKDMEPQLNAQLGEVPAAWVDQGTAQANTCRTMEDLTLRADVQEGVATDSLEFGTTLLVRTRNSQYRLTVLDGSSGDVLIAGGNMLQGITPAHLNGATAGGTALKLGWIGVGLRMELSAGGVRFTTSRVQSIEIEEPGAAHTYAGRTQ
jgi:hypothetical protein